MTHPRVRAKEDRLLQLSQQERVVVDLAVRNHAGSANVHVPHPGKATYSGTPCVSGARLTSHESTPLAVDTASSRPRVPLLLRSDRPVWCKVPMKTLDESLSVTTFSYGSAGGGGGRVSESGLTGDICRPTEVQGHGDERSSKLDERDRRARREHDRRRGQQSVIEVLRRVLLPLSALPADGTTHSPTYRAVPEPEEPDELERVARPLVVIGRRVEHGERIREGLGLCAVAVRGGGEGEESDERPGAASEGRHASLSAVLSVPSSRRPTSSSQAP